MLRIRVSLDGSEYLLPPDADAGALVENITDRLRAGGGFVEIVRTPARSVQVLISAGINLKIETTEVNDEPDESDAPTDEQWLASSWAEPFDIV